MNRLYFWWLSLLQIFLWSFSLHSSDTDNNLSTILRHQDDLFSTLLTTSNYDNYPSLIDYLNNNFPNRMKQFHEDLVFAIFAPSSVRTRILRKGFKNQYQTSSSRGLFNRHARFNTERSLLGFSIDQYNDIAISIRPKYGLVATVPQLLRLMEKGFVYGDDVYVLKESVADRVTWTPGDSLNRTVKKSKNDYNYEYATWDEIFIPWRYRHVVIPYLCEEESVVSIPNDAVLKPECNLNAILGSETRSRYMEFQIWGDVDMSDVKYFFYRQKLKKKQQKILKKNRILFNSIDQLPK